MTGKSRTAQCHDRVVINPPIQCSMGDALEIVVTYQIDPATGELDQGNINSVKKVIDCRQPENKSISLAR